MMKTKMKAFSVLLAAAVMLTPAVQPTAALAKPVTQDIMHASAVGPNDLPPQLQEENGDKPPNVTDAVYGEDPGTPPQVPQEDEAASLMAASSTFSGTNLALNKPVFASGNEVDYLNPELAVDGKGNTRWSSAIEDDQWFYVDLGRTAEYRPRRDSLANPCRHLQNPCVGRR
ncbi:discoidin domain-containing protein [Paenibacillus sp. OAE614]|uniref:discoidin domain-containing protein n=1 Tax=Paenibacillus sp. OAE614 TaxID=2663804 RepID=UPI0033939F74